MLINKQKNQWLFNKLSNKNNLKILFQLKGKDLYKRKKNNGMKMTIDFGLATWVMR